MLSSSSVPTASGLIRLVCHLFLNPRSYVLAVESPLVAQYVLFCVESGHLAIRPGSSQPGRPLEIIESGRYPLRLPST